MSSFCIHGPECVVYDRRHNLPGLAYGSELCNGCLFRSESELRALLYDYIDLSQLIPKADGRNNEAQIFRPKPESSPPINQQAYHLRERIAFAATLAHRVLREHAGRVQVLLPVREGRAVHDALRYLHPRVEDLAGLLDPLAHWVDDERPMQVNGPQILLLLGSYHRAARRMLGLDPRTVALPGECPECGMASLRRRQDEPERVWCHRCPARLTGAEYFRAQQLIFTRQDGGGNP